MLRPTRHCRRHALALAAALLFGASTGLAQNPEPVYPRVSWGGRVHTQAYYFDNDEYQDIVGASSNFIIRRARLNAVVRLSDRVSLSIMPSYENARGRGDFRIREAYGDFLLSDPAAPTSFTLRFGLEKRPFSRLELSTSNILPGIERGAGTGLLPVQSNDLFGAAGFLADDVGAEILVASGAFALRAGVFNGTGDANKDANDAKSFGARATYAVSRQFNIGGAVFSHDGIIGTDSSFRNTGFEVDAQWGKPGDPGLYLLGEVLSGEAFSAADRTMRGMTGVFAYHIRTRGERRALFAVEPSLRFDVADPDVDSDDDGATLIAAGVGLYFTARSQIRMAVEHQSFQADGAESITGVRSGVFVSF